MPQGKKVIYRTDNFGDVKKHRCLVGLTNLLNQLVDEDPKGRNKAKYLANLISRYHSSLYIISKAKGNINMIKTKLLYLIFKDFSQKVVDQKLPVDLESHIFCLLDGLYKEKLEYAKNTKR